jgi:hypothetical protein
MTYRQLGILIFLFFHGVILYSKIPSIIKVQPDNVSYQIQDTLKPKVARTGTGFSSDMEIQVGAFLRENNATALKVRLSDLLNHKVVIVEANGFYKVRVTGCKSIEEMGKLIEALGFLGIKNVWVFHNKPIKELIAIDSIRKDSVNKVSFNRDPINKDTLNIDLAEQNQSSKVADEPAPANEPTINLQVGVFHSKSEALKAKRKIKSKLNLPSEIVREWEYYIVFITGFKTREEMFIYYPKLAALGYPDSFMFDKNKPNQTNK